MISGAGGAFEAFVPPNGAKEIFTKPEVVVGGVFAPTGRAVPEGNGFRISGRWAIASGCHHCDWLGGSCFVFEGDKPKMTPMGPEWIVPLVAASERKIIDTWNVSGLRGSGSHDFEVNDVLVPAHRCIRVPMMECAYPGKLFAFPFFGFLSSAISSVALGIARSAIDEITRLAQTKTPYGMMSTLATRSTAQVAISEADVELRAARALLHATVGEVWDAVKAGRPPSPQDRARLRASATNAASSAARAVDRVYTAGGATSIYSKSPLQRCFRDVHTITQHVFVAPHTHELFGKILLGVEPDAPML
jgi:alkylation response protein AidB-like acyl-CoA dehydrogenase